MWRCGACPRSFCNIPLLLLTPSLLLLTLLLPGCSPFPTSLEPKGIAPADSREGWYHRLFLTDKAFSDSFRCACRCASACSFTHVDYSPSATASKQSLFPVSVHSLLGNGCCRRETTPVVGHTMATAACSCSRLLISSLSSTASLLITAT